MSATRSLILGGTAFIGRHLLPLLLARGDQVTVLNRGHAAPPAGVEQLLADRGDTYAMRRVLAAREWDAVYDISASVQVANLEAMTDLIEYLDGRCGVYVFVSSIAAYQMGNGAFPWTEAAPTTRSRPSKYGGHKAAVEKLLAERRARTGFPYTVLRPAAVYGPHNNIPDGEMAMFLRLLNRRPALVPHDGLVCFPYGHVQDLARALVLAAHTPAARGEIFNVSAEAVTATHYVKTLARIVGVEPEIVYVPDDVLAQLQDALPFNHRFQKLLHSAVSSDKARRLLGFAPEFDFEAGHRQTFDWFMAQGFDRLDTPLCDPTWNISWDFAREDSLLAKLRGA